MSRFALTDVGEGLVEAEILNWRVAPGDRVEVNDVLLEIETAKSVVELPSPRAGVIQELLVAEGDIVPVGTDLVAFVDEADGADEPAPRPLVGYGPTAASSRRRPKVAGALASPPAASPRFLPDIEADVRIPVRGVHRAMVESMTRSAVEIPQATEWLTVDVSKTVELVELWKSDPEFVGIRVSPTVIVAKAVCLALRRSPYLNSRWDPAGAVVLRGSVNLGIAVATDRGLIVPTIKSAHRLTMRELAEAVSHLVATARSGRTTPADQAGGTFTITNVGVFGIDGGTPILNPGESGILAVGAIERRPWVGEDDQIVPRWVTTLALTFDHRVVDGQQGARFLTDVAGLLRDPARALAY